MEYKYKVLVVDDEKIIRASLKKALNQLGFEVINAENGKLGLEAYHEYHPDLIVSDMKMPKMTGLELLEKVREKDEQTPFILMSAYPSLDVAINAIKDKASDFLIKPFSVKQVIQTVNKAFERSELINENRMLNFLTKINRLCLSSLNEKKLIFGTMEILKTYFKGDYFYFLRKGNDNKNKNILYFIDEKQNRCLDVNDEFSSEIDSLINRGNCPENICEISSKKINNYFQNFCLENTLPSKQQKVICLKVQNKIHGLFFVFSDKDEYELKNEFRLIKAGVNELTIALQNVFLYKNLDRRIVELKAVNDASNALIVLKELRNVLLNILEIMTSLGNTDAGAIFLFNKNSSKMELKASIGLDVNRNTEQLDYFGSLLTDILNDDGRDRYYGSSDEKSNIISNRGSLTAYYCIPLRKEGDLIGAVCLFSFTMDAEFLCEEEEILIALSNQVSIAIENAELYENLHKLFIDTTRALAATIESKDPYTKGHSERVTVYAVGIAEELDLPQEKIERIRYASVLHDIGKIGIRHEILMAPRKLTDDEFDQIKKHPLYSEKILSQIKAFDDVVPVVGSHHERFDGNGYPRGKKGNEIPLGGRIIAVADAFEAMTSDRPYRKKMTIDEAINELNRCRGSQFDPNVVDSFISILLKRDYYIQEIAAVR